jgi:predicted O-methyltransferase YrrM
MNPSDKISGWNQPITAPIIDQIQEMVKEVPGWTPIDQLYTLFMLVSALSDRKGDIVEIGSWCGRSTIVLGAAARRTGNVKIHCIDLFPAKNDWKQNEDGSYSFKVWIGDRVFGGYQDQTVWQDPFEKDIAPLYLKHDGILDIFNETIKRNHMTDLVKVFRGNSAMFAATCDPSFKCKLAFIDADHSYEAVVSDIKNIEPFLIEGGWICFDDAFSYYDGVNRAITDCIINNPSYDLCQQMTRKCFVARRNTVA